MQIYIYTWIIALCYTELIEKSLDDENIGR